MRLDEVLAIDLVPGPLKGDIPTGMRIGLIGAGRIVHSGVMSAYRSVGILPVAASDPDSDARERIRQLWGVPAVFADWREMVDAMPLDAVDINIRWDVGLSPMRIEAVREAASRGIHVIIAKALAETWEQCQEIVSLARDGGIKLGVVHNTRYAPAFYGCRALIRAGALGPLLSGSINYHSAIGRQHTNAFNAMHDVSVHSIDILQSWFDRAPREVYASWSRRVDGIWSVLAAIMRFDDGANATMVYDFATRHRRQFEFMAVGETASADGMQDQELPGPARMLRVTLRYGPHEPRGTALELPLQYALSPQSYLATRLDVLQSIGTSREPWASGENVLRTMRTLFALNRSLRTSLPADVGSEEVE